jgi:NADPH2:quinone reductase
MNALELQAFGPGTATIKLVDRGPNTDAAIAPGRVRVRMIAAPVHPSDVNWIEGTYHAAVRRTIWNHDAARLAFDPAGERPLPDPPFTLGVEGVGVVEAAGKGFLARRLVGKRVAVSADGDGTWQSVTTIDAKRALVVPRSLPDEQAAMLFVNPLTAHVMIHEILGVRRGESVLVTAAGSALGRMVIRLGQAEGFRTIAVVRREEQAAELRALGATAAIAIADGEAARLPSEVHRVTEGRGVAHALDCVGGELGTHVIRCLTLGGHVVLYGTLGRAPIELSVRDLMMPVARISGFFLPNWLAQQSLFTKLRVLRAVVRGIESGLLASEIAASFPLDRYEEAIALATRPGHTGKVLLRP